jgi:hypothetical protein
MQCGFSLQGGGRDHALAGDDFEGDCLVSEGSALPDAFVDLDGAYHILNHVPVEKTAASLDRTVGTLRAILCNADISVGEFRELL